MPLRHSLNWALKVPEEIKLETKRLNMTSVAGLVQEV
jgi:hypothetical protein